MYRLERQCIFEIVKLLPGQETTAEYKAGLARIRNIKLSAAVRLRTAQKVNAAYNLTVKKAQANIEITRSYEPEEAAPGDTVTINYTVKNTGNVTLVDIAVDEPEWECGFV